MLPSNGAISEHGQFAAKMWGAGGKAYDDISFAISDALAHAAQRLNAQDGERILDVATGTGWSSRNVARRGAHVTAVDISAELLAAARQLSAHMLPAIEFRLADAERLPFADGQFDGVISTFGAMFAPDQQRAAAELGRVCRKGGRLALATWMHGGAVEKFFGVIARYSDTPPPAASPIAWGDPKHVEALLSRDFELTFERGVSNAYHASTQDIWDWYARGFGPVRHLVDTLDPQQLQAFRDDVDAYHGHYAVEAGLLLKREYLVTIGRRR